MGLRLRLSYTTFSPTNLRSNRRRSAHRPDQGDGRREEHGRRAGDEVAQLYLRDVVSSVTRPTKELRGFERVTLKPGETRTVTFALGPAELSLIDRRMQRVVEPGRFDVMVGTSSTTLTTATLDVVER